MAKISPLTAELRTFRHDPFGELHLGSDLNQAINYEVEGNGTWKVYDSQDKPLPASRTLAYKSEVFRRERLNISNLLRWVMIAKLTRTPPIGRIAVFATRRYQVCAG
jgi:hypothetical protein